MGGKHTAVDRRRLYREMVRLAMLLLIFGVVLVGGAVLISNWLESGDATPLEATGQPSTTTSILSATLVTTTPTISTTTTIAPATTTESSTTTTTFPALVEPAEIIVIVLNSTGTKGIAGRLTAQLAELGYQMLEADNYSPQLEVSRVWYVEGLLREATLLVEQIPDAIVEIFPSGEAESDIVVVLGASFSE